MSRARTMLLTAIPLLAGQQCIPVGGPFDAPHLETRFAFTNFSTQYYATLGIREHRENRGDEYHFTPLLAPGATVRLDFAADAGAGCPDAVDLRLLLYDRVRSDLPIGSDETEEVIPSPIVAGEILGVAACGVASVETYTVVNWDAPAGTARVKIAQCSTIDDWLTTEGPFNNASGAWEIEGVAPALADMTPPELAEMSPIAGRVVLANGHGAAGVGVMIRPRYRVRLDCRDAQNPDDAGYGDPIDYTITDEAGAFRIDRPAGVYTLELFSDVYAFRPATLAIETPLPNLTLLAEPIP